MALNVFTMKKSDCGSLIFVLRDKSCHIVGDVFLKKKEEEIKKGFKNSPGHKCCLLILYPALALWGEKKQSIHLRVKQTLPSSSVSINITRCCGLGLLKV